jgi:hypothetical protein
MNNPRITKLWENYTNSLKERYFAQISDNREGIGYWQDIIFFYTLVIFFPIGILISIPSIIISLLTKLYLLAAYDFIAVVLVSVVFFGKKIGLLKRKILFIANIYLLGIVLLIYLDFRGPGNLYLFGISIFSVLVLGVRFGIRTVFLNLIVYFMIISGVTFFDTSGNFDERYTIFGWVIISLNSLAINLIMVVAIGKLINGLVENIKYGKALETKLASEAERLREVIRLLEMKEKELETQQQNLENQVFIRTRTLRDKNDQLAKFNELFVGRENRIKELKSELRMLREKLGHR